jgi:flagellar hook assembly protein FlgD
LVVSSASSSFRPGFPEEGRFLRLSVDLSKAARTTVEIQDKRGNTIATLLHRRHRSSGRHSLHWNGYNDFGRLVPPGEYVVQATASTTGGTVTGNLNISVLEDPAVHRQYLRNTPYQDETQTLDRTRSAHNTVAPRQTTRRR